MRYLCFVKMAEDVGPPTAGLVAAMGQEMERATADGTLLDAGGLHPMASGTSVVVRAGAATTVDGPFTEAKEVVGGYSIMEFRDHAEAVENARRMAQLHVDHWPGWEGSVEVRRISDDGPPTLD